MWKLTISSIRAQKARFFLTSFAVILGVAFMAGTLVLTDTIKQSYDDLAGSVFQHTDAVVQSAHSVKDAQGKDVRGSVDAAVVSRVASAPGVAVAEPQVTGVAMVVGKDGDLLESNPNRPVPIAFGWQSDSRLNPMQLVHGHAPAKSEVVIDVASARTGKFAVGDRVTVVDKAGSQQYTLAGIAKYSGKDDAVGAQVVAFAPETAAAVLGQPGRFNAVGVVAAPGVSQSEVAANIRATVHSSSVEVLTGAEAIAQAREVVGRVAGVPEHVPDDVRDRCPARRVVRDLQHVLDHGRAADRATSRCCGPSAPSASRSCGRWCSSRCSWVCSHRRSVCSSASRPPRESPRCSPSSASSCRRPARS